MIVSIIIAVKGYCENLKECVDSCLKLDYENYEIIVLPDTSFKKDLLSLDSKVKIVPTGNVTPPFKRDIGAKEANGQILAFLDDDAYPVKDWLKHSVDIFRENENIACVCGPAVTPNSDSLLQKASGLVYSSLFVSGNHVYRYLPGERRKTNDFPSCNLLIRKDIFDKVEGFDKPFWPGEDTFLCLKVLKEKKDMIYDPKILVYHHRRTLFKKHLIQIKNYAYHRGYFAKKYPETSLQVEYFIPSLFVLAAILGFIFSNISFISFLHTLMLTVYSLLIMANSLFLSFTAKESFWDKIKLFFLSFSGIITTHFVYGVYFIKGLFAKKMPEE